jgi:hypothetical protein
VSANPEREGDNGKGTDILPSRRFPDTVLRRFHISGVQASPQEDPVPKDTRVSAVLERGYVILLEVEPTFLSTPSERTTHI